MSNSFLAGSRLRAERVAFQRLWSVSSTVATAAIGTGVTVVLTAPSSTYTAGSAYMLHFSSLLNTAAGAPMAGRFEVRDTNAAGAQRMGTRLYQLPGNGSNYAYNEWWPVANTGGADITSRVLTLCYSSSAGTSFLNASSVLPYWFTCYYVGLATDYTEAVAL